jgi:hypothetical protein
VNIYGPEQDKTYWTAWGIVVGIITVATVIAIIFA